MQQSSVEATGSLERRLSVRVPAEEIERRVDERLASLTRTAKVKGFRPGKVPLKVVRQQYGAQVRQEVLGQVLQASYSEAVTEQSLNPAGSPRIEPEQMEPGLDLTYTATFEVYPEIELKPVDGAVLERPKVDVTEADIDRMIERLRKRNAEWESVDRGAEQGDRLTVDFEGTIDGETFEGGSAENVPFEIGGGQMLADFESAFVGRKAGESFGFDLTFPEDYNAEDLAGKQAHFEVTLHQVEAQRLPAVDEAFAESLGVEGGIERLSEELRRSMEREVAQNIEGQIKQQALDRLLEANPIDVPEALVSEEIDRMRHDSGSRMGLNHEQSHQLPAELFQEQAQKRVALGLLVAELIRQQGIELDKERVQAKVDQLVQGFNNPQEMAQAYMNDQQSRRAIEGMVLEEQVVDWLIERLEVREVEKDFETLMNPEA